MMKRFYTSAHLVKGEVLVRGYEGKERFERRVQCRPYLFVPGNGDFRTVDGIRCGRVDFEDVEAAKSFAESYPSDYYGMDQWLYPWVNDNFPGIIDHDLSLIDVAIIDIETDSDGGYANIKKADKAIWTISVRRRGVTHVFGVKDYQVKDDSIKFYRCISESDMLRRFVDWWSSDYPDVLTGWNSMFYDVVYLVNRMERILDNDWVKRLSPWGIVKSKMVHVEKREEEEETYELFGIPHLDYLPIYRKFTYKNHPTNALNYIAQEELKEKKVDYSDVGTLADLYRLDYQRFVDYNAHDVVLVERLDRKIGLLKLIYTFALDAKVMFPDTVTTVRLWDVVIHNYLLEQKVVVPQKKKGEKREFVGGYVKPVQKGKHGWVVSFDLTSLYPHLIMQYNISPETLSGQLDERFSVPEIVGGAFSRLNYDYVGNDQAIAANSALYDRSRHGFLPRLMEKYFSDRAAYKKQMLAAKQELEKDPDNAEIESRVSTFNNLQEVRKRLLNGAYGALGNAGFRWFNVVNAEAITSSGQLSIQWVVNAMNRMMNRLCKTQDKDYILAADTDSMYILVQPLVDTYGLDKGDPHKTAKILSDICEDKISGAIDSSFKELAKYVNGREQKMHMKREYVAKSGLWTGKKFYILDVYIKENVVKEKPELVIKGMAMVKSSSPKVCQEGMKKATEIVMRGTEKELHAYVKEFKARYQTLSYEDIAEPCSVSFIGNRMVAGVQVQIKLELGTKGVQPHVRGAIHYNNMLEKYGLTSKYYPIRSGDKGRTCHMLLPNPFMDKAFTTAEVLPPEFGLEKYIDRTGQLQKTFFQPMQNVFTAAGWTPEPQDSLSDFFEVGTPEEVVKKPKPKPVATTSNKLDDFWN